LFGTLRYFLATLVVLSHNNITLYGKNIGVMAVVVFYLLSGYMMTGLIRRRYASLSAMGAFYWDRLLRIYPQYLLFLTLTLLAIHTLPIQTPYLAVPLDGQKLFANLSIIPLNFFMFNQLDKTMLLPQAWSLGTEWQFYLTFPFVLLLHSRLRPLIAGLSVLVFALAMTGQLQTDWYGYRLLPGVWFIFLTGSFIYDRGHKTVLGLWLTVFLIGSGCYIAHIPYQAFNVEVIVGFLIGVVLVLLLRQGSQNKWDDYLGHLSYGVFLCHFLVIWLVQTIANIEAQALCLLVWGLASLLSAVGYHSVESPLLKWRKKGNPS